MNVKFLGVLVIGAAAAYLFMGVPHTMDHGPDSDICQRTVAMKYADLNAAGPVEDNPEEFSYMIQGDPPEGAELPQLKYTSGGLADVYQQHTDTVTIECLGAKELHPMELAWDAKAVEGWTKDEFRSFIDERQIEKFTVVGVKIEGYSNAAGGGQYEIETAYLWRHYENGAMVTQGDGESEYYEKYFKRQPF